jgi:hypothetical protein
MVVVVAAAAVAVAKPASTPTATTRVCLGRQPKGVVVLFVVRGAQ